MASSERHMETHACVLVPTPLVSIMKISRWGVKSFRPESIMRMLAKADASALRKKSFDRFVTC